MRVTNQKINFLSKGHSTEGPKIPFISNPKKPTCASKRFMLELAILQCVNVSGPQFSVTTYELSCENILQIILSKFFQQSSE